MILVDRWIDISEYLKEKVCFYGRTNAKISVIKINSKKNFDSYGREKFIKRVRGGAEVIEDEVPLTIVDCENIFNTNKEAKIKIAKKQRS